MAEPKWVLEKTVRAVHRRQIAEHGGVDGVRDEGGLTSTLARPRNLYHLGDPRPSLANMAAAYAYGIVGNHPFIDGNKRTALVTCRLFLALNGTELRAEAADKYLTFIKLAAGDLTEDALARWIASYT